MDDEGADYNRENLAWFGFVIKKQPADGKHTKLTVDVKNRGIPIPEVILHVEAWLEQTRDDFKRSIKEKFYFDNKSEP